MGKARFFLFVIKINRDIDVWDELFCKTQGRWSKRVEMGERETKGPDRQAGRGTGTWH